MDDQRGWLMVVRGRVELAAANPDSFHPILANALHHLGSQLRDLGLPAEGLVFTREAVTIRRELAAATPDRYRPDLADSLDDLGRTLSVLGLEPDAEAA